MGWEGNHLVDGDDGSHPQSPKYTGGHTCPTCDGKGVIHISCCGDDISADINETDLCPTCLEHCGTEGETCDRCDGTGEISEQDHYDLHHDY